MNIENIAALAEQLRSSGFENARTGLLKRICFKPESFIISQSIEKGKDQLRFHLFFERERNQNSYALKYYDAILQKGMDFTDTIINGINLSALEKKMIEIDWRIAFELETKRQWNVEDKSTWETELKIESIVDDLTVLEGLEQGKTLALNLKLKYWEGAPYQEIFGTISPSKNRLEISQRFYCLEGQAGISVDEAYRFLQNRWLEKEMQTKRKEPNDGQTDESKADSHTSSGNGLLKKKHLSKSKGTRKKSLININ